MRTFVLVTEIETMHENNQRIKNNRTRSRSKNGKGIGTLIAHETMAIGRSRAIIMKGFAQVTFLFQHSGGAWCGLLGFSRGEWPRGSGRQPPPPNLQLPQILLWIFCQAKKKGSKGDWSKSGRTSERQLCGI